MKAKKVGTGEEGHDGTVEMPIVDSGEDIIDAGVKGFVWELCKGNKNIHAVHHDTTGLTLRRGLDGINDGSSQLVVSFGGAWCGGSIA